MVDKKGFTIIEVMILVAILGILLAIAIPQINRVARMGDNTTLTTITKNTGEGGVIKGVRKN